MSIPSGSLARCRRMAYKKLRPKVGVAQSKGSSLSQTAFLPVRVQCVTCMGFPRSSERGSVEAARAVTKADATACFPRSSERGSVEAVPHGIGGSNARGAFRVLRNAAPLKPRLSKKTKEIPRRFPRSSERGSVEAAICYDVINNLNADFPRSSERGSVEAIRKLR